LPNHKLKEKQTLCCFKKKRQECKEFPEACCICFRKSLLHPGVRTQALLR
jgi:hypothetical protein